MSKQIARDEAFELLKKYNQNEALIKHALAVEGVMRHFAQLYNEDIEKWGIIGLLHDIDYEKYPDQHCKKAIEILESEDIGVDYIHAICSHGYGLCSDIKPEELMEVVLYTIDELTGLINAVAVMRPSKSMSDLEYKSVIKKYKTPAFAAGVDRKVIENGIAMLDEVCKNKGFNLTIDLKYVIEQCIIGMRNVSKALGL